MCCKKLRHAAVLKIYSCLNVPDNIYNWVVSFFRDHSHNTRFGNQISVLKAILISASIVQGSFIGPVSYVTTASYLQLVSQTSNWSTYNDDIHSQPAILVFTRSLLSSELINISNWACNNNLQLNRAKSTEVVFVKPRSRRLQSEPPSVISGLTQDA